MLPNLKAALLRSLKNYPVLTNTAIYASFYTAAELSQQTYNKYYSPEKPEFDFAYAAKIAGTGSTIYAPTLYFWYKFLDRKFAGTAMKMVMTKVFSDQLFMSPILLAAFYTVTSLLEGKEKIFEELQQKYWTTFVANQSFWIPAQTINFYMVPSHLRVVYVASASFLWINVLCYIKRQKHETDESSVLKTN